MGRLKEFSIESLTDIDGGRPAAAFLHEVQTAVRDCHDRPGSAAARKVTLTMSITPVVDEDGMCESVRFEFEAKHTTPNRRTKVYEASIDQEGKMLYSPASPKVVDQTTIFDEAAE